VLLINKLIDEPTWEIFDETSKEMLNMCQKNKPLYSAAISIANFWDLFESDRASENGHKTIRMQKHHQINMLSFSIQFFRSLQ